MREDNCTLIRYTMQDNTHIDYTKDMEQILIIIIYSITYDTGVLQEYTDTQKLLPENLPHYMNPWKIRKNEGFPKARHRFDLKSIQLFDDSEKTTL